MRLLTVIPVMGIGGAEAVAAGLATDALQHGHRSALASAGGFRADAVAAAGVEHVQLPLAGRRPTDLARAVARLRSHTRDRTPDLVHAHNVKAALVARLALGRRTPVVATLHGVPAAELPAAARILRRTAARVVAVSPHVADALARHHYPQTRIEVIENSVQPPPRRDRAQARARLGLAADAPVVLCAARMSDQKRHDLLLDAWPHVPADAVLLLAGDGPNRDRIAARARALDADDRIRLLGPRTDMDWLLAAADLLVLPTDWEGLPISLLEAMGVGLPVVVSRVGGVVETLGEAVCLVEPDSAPALADAMTDLLADRAGRSALGARGKALVTEHYGPDLMLGGYRDLYHRMLGGAR